MFAMKYVFSSPVLKVASVISGGRFAVSSLVFINNVMKHFYVLQPKWIQSSSRPTLSVKGQVASILGFAGLRARSQPLGSALVAWRASQTTRMRGVAALQRDLPYGC